MVNILKEIEWIKKQIKCLWGANGITILRIGDNPPDRSKRNTLQVRANGDQFLIDKDGELELLTGSTSGNTNLFPIEVVVGSAEAIAAGIVAGTSITQANFVDHYPEIFIGNVNLYSIVKNDPIPYFLKDPSDDTAQLYNVALVDGDTVKIKFQ